MGDPFIFWTLRLFLFAVLFVCGVGISKGKKQTFVYCFFVAIVAFALVEGLRWMRGTDYENYLYNFRTGITYKDEPLYQLFVTVVYSLRLSPTFVFILLSGLLMTGIGINFKNYRKAAIWGLPLIYLMLGYQAENLVRQYFAISFLGFAYYFYCVDKYKSMLLCLLIAPFIHTSAVLGSLVFLLFTWKKIELVNISFFVGAYLVAYFIWNPEWLSDYALLLSGLNVDDSSAMSVYINHADHHFSTEGSLSAMEGIEVRRSRINIILYFLTDIAVIIVGYFACKKNQKLTLLYYFSFLGILFQVLFGDIQVLMRFGYLFSWMCPILIALVITFKDYGKYEILKFVLWFLIFARYAFYGIIHQIGKITMEEGCMFIWDK